MYLKTKKTLILTLYSVLLLFFFVLYHLEYSYAQNSYVDLTAQHIAEPINQGKTFKLKGEVLSAFTSKHGLKVITLNNKQKNIIIEVVVFPSIGKLKFKPTEGDTVEVRGNLSSYKGKPQLKPLSTLHIELLKKEKPTLVPLGEAIYKIGEKLLIGPVKIEVIGSFTSKKGKIHTKLVLDDSKTIVNGIMFNTPENSPKFKLIKKQKLVTINAKVDKHKGSISIIVNKINPN
jgi:exonuclease VII large subunit